MGKKILFSLYDGIYPYHTGGMEIFNYYLIKELAARGLPIFYSATKRLNFSGPIFHKVYHFRPQKVFWPLQDFLYLLFHRGFSSILISYSDAHWLIWRLFTVIAKVCKLDMIIVIHHGKSVPQDHYTVYKNFFTSAKHIIAVSSDIKRNYDIKYGVSCKVIFPLLPFELCNEDVKVLKKRYSISYDSIVVSMVGTIKAMKNPDTLIKALAILGPAYLTRNKLYAVYAGGGDMVTELKSLSKKLNVAQNVVFLGKLPKETVNQVFKMTDVFVISSDYEGTSVSLLEAMYNNIPIIVSRSPGLITMLEDENETLSFEVRNEYDLAYCIKETIEKPNKAKERANNAHARFMSDYNYCNVIENFSLILGYGSTQQK